MTLLKFCLNAWISISRQVLQADVWYSNTLPGFSHCGQPSLWRIWDGMPSQPMSPLPDSGKDTWTTHCTTLPPAELQNSHCHFNSIKPSISLHMRRETRIPRHRNYTPPRWIIIYNSLQEKDKHRQISSFPVSSPHCPQAVFAIAK